MGRDGALRGEGAASGLVFVHDFVATPEYFVIVENPIKPHTGGLLAAAVGRGPLSGALAPDLSRNARLTLVPRHCPSRPSVSLDCGLPFFAFHLANAWQDGPDVVVDACVLPRFAFVP